MKGQAQVHVLQQALVVVPAGFSMMLAGRRPAAPLRFEILPMKKNSHASGIGISSITPPSLRPSVVQVAGSSNAEDELRLPACAGSRRSGTPRTLVEPRRRAVMRIRTFEVDDGDGWSWRCSRAQVGGDLGAGRIIAFRIEASLVLLDEIDDVRGIRTTSVAQVVHHDVVTKVARCDISRRSMCRV